MFWGCFSYDRKGPMHIWKKETAKERREANTELETINQQLEPMARAEWEVTTALRRMHLRGRPGGRAPTWRFTAQNGAVTRGKGTGIDWYRYQKLILKDKLLPFAQSCAIERPGTIVQEDKAPAHSSRHQQVVFDAYNVSRLLWPGNSPDLNAIEPCWPYLKRITTRKGAPSVRKTAERLWIKAWDDLEQERIRRWIERIERHIQEVLRLEGGNEYREGRS